MDCPICHVKNENDSRFCQECGHRLTGTSNRESSQEKLKPAADKAGNLPGKLKSPLLEGGSWESSDTDKSHGEMDRLRKMSSDKSKSKDVEFVLPKGNPFDPRINNNLNIPTSGDNVNTESNDNSEKKNFGKKGLHSPLLSGDEFDEDDFIEEEHTSFPRVRASRPLSNPSNDFAPKRGTGLRSPILSGADNNESYFEAEYEDEELFDDDDNPNPNILRSPLLAARVPIDHPQENPPIKPQVKPQVPPKPAPVQRPVQQPAPSQFAPPPQFAQPEPSIPPQRPAVDLSASTSATSAFMSKAVPPMPGAAPEAPPVRTNESVSSRKSSFTYNSARDIAEIDEQFDTVDMRRGHKSSPLPYKYGEEKTSSSNFKFIGICAIGVLLIKLYCLTGYASTDWFKFTPFVIDQFVQIAVIICLILVCMLPRS